LVAIADFVVPYIEFTGAIVEKVEVSETVWRIESVGDMVNFNLKLPDLNVGCRALGILLI
jgi:hypothetical protein